MSADVCGPDASGGTASSCRSADSSKLHRTRRPGTMDGMVMACFTRVDPIRSLEQLVYRPFSRHHPGFMPTRRYKQRAPAFDREIDSRRSWCLDCDAPAE